MRTKNASSCLPWGRRPRRNGNDVPRRRLSPLFFACAMALAIALPARALNGKPVTDWKIRHKDVMAGGELVFEMTDKAFVGK